MKILFFMHHLGSFRMYESVVRQLAARGHELHLVTGRSEALGWERALGALLAESPLVRWTSLDPPADFWSDAAKTIRLWADYLRYFAPEYASTPKLLQRAEERMPPLLVRISRSWMFAGTGARAGLVRWLRRAERALPLVPDVREFMAAERPDVVLVTPLVYLASTQMEVLRTAKALGLRNGFCVGSWDHLSSKALLRDMPDRVFVWNDTQRDEALRFHGVPADRVIVTGAQCYDQWFGRQPSRSREAFCQRVGLPPDRPFLLYVGSALFHGSPVEAEFVARWLEELRTSANPAVRDVPVLLRPHPARTDEWDSVDFSRYADVRVYGSNPVDPASKDDYFESLYYSGAVVGLNTSAFIEGAIVGRPVHTVLLPEFWENQEGTLHFHYLFTVGGGVLRGGRSYAEHHAQLAESLTRGNDGGEGRRFVEAFVRPRGLEVPATESFVADVEAMTGLPEPVPVPATAGDAVLRTIVVAPALRVAQVLFGDRAVRTDWSQRTRALQEKHAREEEAREQRMRERAEKLAERERERIAEEQRRAAAEAERIETMRRHRQQKEDAAAAAEAAQQGRRRQREAAKAAVEAAKVQAKLAVEREKTLARERRVHDKEQRTRTKQRAQRRAAFKERAVRLVRRLFAADAGGRA